MYSPTVAGGQPPYVHGEQPHYVANASSQTPVAAPIFLNPAQEGYYRQIHSLLPTASEVIAIRPNNSTDPNAWRDLRVVVERVVYDEKTAVAFALDTDGTTVLLLAKDRLPLKAGMVPITAWFTPANQSPRVSEPFSMLTPIQAHYTAAILKRLEMTQGQNTVLIIDAQDLGKQSLDPARDLKQAVLDLLKREKIFAYAHCNNKTRMALMPAQNAQHDHFSEENCGSNQWYSLGYPEPGVSTPAVQQQSATSALTNFATVENLDISPDDLLHINFLEKLILEKKGNEILAVSPNDVNPKRPNFWSLRCAVQYLLLEKKVIDAWAIGRGGSMHLIRVTPQDQIAAGTDHGDWFTRENPCPQGSENYKQKTH